MSRDLLVILYHVNVDVDVIVDAHIDMQDTHHYRFWLSWAFGDEQSTPLFANLLLYLQLDTNDYPQGGWSMLIDEMAMKVDAFNTLFDEKHTVYAAADRSLDGIFTVC